MTAESSSFVDEHTQRVASLIDEASAYSKERGFSDIRPEDLLGENFVASRELAKTIDRKDLPAAQVEEVIDDLGRFLVWGSLSDDYNPGSLPLIARSATLHHEKGRQVAMDALRQQPSPSEARAVSVLSLYEHTLKRELSLSFVQALYEQGALVYTPSFIEEYIARRYESYRIDPSVDRSVKPDLSSPGPKVEIVIERAHAMDAWAKRYNGVVPAIWDDYAQPTSDLYEALESGIDLPVELVDALTEHPDPDCILVLAKTQLLDDVQFGKVFERLKVDTDINWSKVLQYQYRMRVEHLNMTPNEALEDIRILELTIGRTSGIDLTNRNKIELLDTNPFVNSRKDHHGGVLNVRLRSSRYNPPEERLRGLSRETGRLRKERRRAARRV